MVIRLALPRRRARQYPVGATARQSGRVRPRTSQGMSSQDYNTSPLLRNISDTARWAALYRARETERPDALFRDPFARRLAGERGEEIARTLAGGKDRAWPWVVRTCLFDQFIASELAAGADLVVNLAAGLDARPYRLDLPASLPWIEVDLPEILAYKEEILGDAQPRCALERVRLDLGSAGARRELFERLGARGHKALIITEGFLTYLAPEEVTALARDLAGAARSRASAVISDLPCTRGSHRAGSRPRGTRKLSALAFGYRLARAPQDAAARDGCAFEPGRRALQVRPEGRPGVFQAVRLAAGRRPLLSPNGGPPQAPAVVPTADGFAARVIRRARLTSLGGSMSSRKGVTSVNRDSAKDQHPVSPDLFRPSRERPHHCLDG